MDLTQHLHDLPIERRLALSYAPRAAQPIILGFLALDNRLAGIVRQAREPLLGQIKLSWWRDRLNAKELAGGLGDPLLAMLDQWGDLRPALAALADGWEHLLNEAQLDEAALIAFATARGKACAAMAMRLGVPGAADEAERAGHDWALADLAQGLSDPTEIAMARGILRGRDQRRVDLPRDLRPLTVLHGLARRKQGASSLLNGPIDGLVAIRLGLFGF